MIHGHPRRRAARRIRLFFKHAALVFAYTTYISIAALIVLKMAARGGYADQVGMTHPVARLVMIALVSAVAIGVFWWLKHELGDHTRQEFTHTLSELTSHGRDGYQRGQQAYDRPRNLDPQSVPTQNHRPGDEPGSGANFDQPLTGTPVAGRSPSGRPPTTNSRSRLSAASQTSPHQSDGLAAHAAVGQAAATALAPEVVAGHVAATHLTQKLHHNPGAPSTPPNMPRVAEASPGPPVAGRSATIGLTVPPQPDPDIRSDRTHSNADRAAELLDQTTAEGRSLRP